MNCGCLGNCCCGADPATVARWGCHEEPFVYCDDLGPGGVTAPRLAQVTGRQLGQVIPSELPSCPACQWFDMRTMKCEPIPEGFPGHCPAPQGPGGQPGGVDPEQPGGWWPPQWPPGGGAPAPGAPPIPGQVPEAACQVYTDKAREEGKREAHGEVVKVAAISAAVSAVVGGLLGYVIGS